VFGVVQEIVFMKAELKVHVAEGEGQWKKVGPPERKASGGPERCLSAPRA
jgi:hypothetical protein